MTGYHIRVGYNSKGPRPEHAAVLREVVTKYCGESTILMEIEKEREWPNERIVRDMAGRFERSLANPENDSSLTFIEKNASGYFEVMLLASGGGFERELKEATARAFCRIVMAAMHRRGLEVSIVVA